MEAFALDLEVAVDDNEGLAAIGAIGNDALASSYFDDGSELIEPGELPAGKVNQSACLLYTSPSPRDRTRSRMPSSA